MKRFLIVLLVFTTFNTFSQNHTIDSLKLQLRREIADTGRVMLLSSLSAQYWFSNPDTALKLAQQGIALARQKAFVKGEAYCLTSLGYIFYETGNYPKSFEFYLQSLKKFESINNQAGLIRAYVHLGIIYSAMGDSKLAGSYFRKGKALAEISSDPLLLNTLLLDLGDFYEKQNLLDSARIYTNRAYEMSVRLKNTPLDYVALNNLGNIYSKMQKREIAMGYYRESLPLEKGVKDFDCLCETTIGMAELFKNAGQADSSLYYARLSLATAREFGFTKWELKASAFLSTYFKDLNRIDSAYYYQVVNIAAKDSLFSQEKVKEEQNLSFTERIRQQEIEEAKKLAQEERKSNIQLLAIVTFISFFFALLFVFSKRHVNPKIIKFLGLLGLLLMFEFISLFLHPYIAIFTHHKPILMLLILVVIASILIPIKHALQRWVKEKLARKTLNAAIVVSDNIVTE